MYATLLGTKYITRVFLTRVKFKYVFRPQIQYDLD